MANIALRGCDEELVHAMKRAGERRGLSLNRLILETLRTAFLGSDARPRRHDDLDHLAGTWSEEEGREFEAATAEFAAIDEELWTGGEAAQRP